MTVKEEIERSTAFGQELEDLIVKRGTLTFVDQTRDRILAAYWPLVFDYDKSILHLLRAGFYGGVFALVRPLVEALVRDAQLLQNFRNMNSGGGCLDVGNEDRVGGKKRVAQRRGVADQYLGITGADGHRRLDQADIRYRVSGNR